MSVNKESLNELYRQFKELCEKLGIQDIVVTNTPRRFNNLLHHNYPYNEIPVITPSSDSEKTVFTRKGLIEISKSRPDVITELSWRSTKFVEHLSWFLINSSDLLKKDEKIGHPEPLHNYKTETKKIPSEKKLKPPSKLLLGMVKKI